MPDIESSCVQCKETFLFTEKEQDIFYQRNMPPPQRCSKCRSKRPASSVGAVQRYEIVCDNCGKRDQVPFQPKVGRTVLCRDCHEASRSRARFA
ncbi:MAG TPA: CxxC-x17-CxxC domain-containing protein [Pyrinomonadaceae bacterium]|nr:CxxC-x17-CxxC domain-containing protein [Pyrinomonadaceae bacterium]